MARDRESEREIVYVERDEGSLKPILFGALLGLAVGLLFAPQSGDETRRLLKRRLRSARALAEEKVDELRGRLGARSGKATRADEDDDDEEPADERAQVRGELERRLAEARARRRPVPEDDEEPVA